MEPMITVLVYMLAAVFAIYTICDICMCTGWKLGWAKLFSALFVVGTLLWQRLIFVGIEGQLEWTLNVLGLSFIAFTASCIAEGFCKVIVKKWGKK